MRSGKDMLCKAMETVYGAKTFSLATHLKALCGKILEIELPMLSPWDYMKLDTWKNNRGLLCEEGIRLSKPSLEIITEETGFGLEDVSRMCNELKFRNVRELLQLVGTEVIRTIDGTWHIRKTLQDINKLPENSIACVDDIRFQNELDAFRKAGADSFFIIRNNAENVSHHPSENSLFPNNFPKHRIIVNNNTPENLCKSFANQYANGFDTVSEKPIFISDYPEYNSVNIDFGTELTPIVEETIRQNRERETFMKDGLITFRNNTKFNLKELLEEMGITQTYTHRQVGGRFVIDNPVAYENLKRWL
jgi:hypothetical protein